MAIEPATMWACVWQVCTLEEHLQWLQVGNILGILVTDFFADPKHQRATSGSLVLCAWLIAQACQPFKCCTSLQANGLNEISCFSLCHWVFTDRHSSFYTVKNTVKFMVKKGSCGCQKFTEKDIFTMFRYYRVTHCCLYILQLITVFFIKWYNVNIQIYLTYQNLLFTFKMYW